jgi:hypothetical protein
MTDILGHNTNAGTSAIYPKVELAQRTAHEDKGASFAGGGPWLDKKYNKYEYVFI